LDFLQTFVGIFLVSFIVHMAMACAIERLCSSSNVGGRSVIARRIVASISFYSVILVAYFYHRHNRLCEPYVYSMFCLSEYLSIVLNMIFHLIAPYMIWRENSRRTDINQNWTHKNDYAILKI
jgi:apolipoprotein N-acyltransferase